MFSDLMFSVTFVAVRAIKVGFDLSKSTWKFCDSLSWACEDFCTFKGNSNSVRLVSLQFWAPCRYTIHLPNWCDSLVLPCKSMMFCCWETALSFSVCNLSICRSWQVICMLYTSTISSLYVGKNLSLCCRVTIGNWSPHRFLNCLFSRPANAS